MTHTETETILLTLDQSCSQIEDFLRNQSDLPPHTREILWRSLIDCRSGLCLLTSEYMATHRIPPKYLHRFVKRLLRLTRFSFTPTTQP